MISAVEGETFMQLKKAVLISGAAVALMGIAPVANAQEPTVTDGGQNVQNCGNISVNGGNYEPHNSPNFVKCTQVPTVEYHPFFAAD